MGEPEVGFNLLVRGCRGEASWADGYPADGKIPAHNPFLKHGRVVSKKKLFQVALGPGGQDN